MTTHVVIKPLPLGKETLPPSTEVDASSWRNARLLVEQRYLSPIQQTVQPDERDKRVGRKEQNGSQPRN